ncbi:MAG: hypothetical protein LBC98_10245 [Prevotellaceae bacterium]|jgi:hypothetical protein|nr:hypothetical protein [Prevotellaceae bacterium]
MKSKILNIIASVLVVFCFGCNNETEEILAPKVLKADMYFEFGGGSGQIELSLPPENVRVVSGDLWCSASKDGSMVNVSVQANTKISGRTAMVALSYKGIEDILVPVSQKGAVFDIPNSSIETDCKAITLKTYMRQEAPLSIETDADWLHVTVEPDSLVIAVDDNKSLSPRTGILELTCAGVTIPVTVEQAAMRFSVSRSFINSPLDGGTYLIFIENDFDFTPSTSDAWLHLSIDGNVLEVEVDALPPSAYPRRQGSITIVSGLETLTVSVQQVYRTLTYNELLGEYTIKVKLINDMYYGSTEFVSTLKLEPRTSSTYYATIEDYIPDNGFFGYAYDTPYEQYPFIVTYSNGALVIRNNSSQLIGIDCIDFFDIYWDIYFLAAASAEDYSFDTNLRYVGEWNGDENVPVFTFMDGGDVPNFKVIGFMPYWWSIYDETYDMPDGSLLLYDWVLTKNDPIP